MFPSPNGECPTSVTDVYDIRQPRPVHFSELHFDQCEEYVGCERSVPVSAAPPAFIYVVVLVW